MRMKITYPNGTVHEGDRDLFEWTNLLGITNYDFTGKRVLDIATDEGWWAFWAEMNGAKYVEASDVENGEDYDWGAKKDWEWIKKLNENRGGRKVFDFHHKNLKSNVVVKKESIYDVKGNFDWVFAHGLIYHLRHPLLAIDNVKKVCNGVFIFETEIDVSVDQTIAQSKFYKTMNNHRPSFWTNATTACYASWLNDSGFTDVYYTNKNFKGDRRKIFIGVVDPSYNDIFKNNENLVYCDEKYWQEVFEKIKF